MRANTDETLRRGSELREKHGSWMSVSRNSRDGRLSPEKGKPTSADKARRG